MMADSPVAAASSPRSEAHPETESEPEFKFGEGTESDSEPDSESKHRVDSGSEPRADSEPEVETNITAGADAANSDAGNNWNHDAVSFKTTTSDFFSGDYTPNAAPGPESKQHKLGLDINQPWGWDGSSYSDYE